jgi:hypothetical protein
MSIEEDMDDLSIAVKDCYRELLHQQKIEDFKQSIIGIVTFPIEAIVLILLVPFLGIAKIIQVIKN